MDIRGARLGLDRNQFFRDTAEPFRQRDLILPEVIVSDFDMSLDPALKSVFDRVWNAAGLEGSANFDEEGNWIA